MTRETREEQARPQRVSVNAQRDKLNVLGLDTKNYYYRWVNDIEDRLLIFKNAGYLFVEKSEIKSSGDPTIDTSKGTDSRVRKGVGGGRVAYLMKLPLEFKKEYDADKEAEILETERAMRRLKTETGHHMSPEADYGKADIGQSNRR
jgi:hypothetical protein